MKDPRKMKAPRKMKKPQPKKHPRKTPRSTKAPQRPLNPMTTSAARKTSLPETISVPTSPPVQTRTPATAPKPTKTLTPARLREEILSALSTLRVPVSNDQLDEALQTAESRGDSHLEFLWELLGTVAADRQERVIARRIREAYFPNQGSLEDFDWSFNAAVIDQTQIEQLATGDWVERFENLVLLGQSGVGKSRLLEGIGRRLCVLGKHVRYTTCSDLITQLIASLADGTLPRQISY